MIDVDGRGERTSPDRPVAARNEHAHEPTAHRRNNSVTIQITII
jgi:hypothetical protein